MKTYIIIISTLIIVFAGCQNKTNTENDIKTINVKHTRINLNLDSIFDPRKIIKIDDKHFVIIKGRENTFYELIDIVSMKHYPFGIKGRGPGEVLDGYSLYYDTAKNSLYSYSAMKGEYYSYKIQNIKKGIGRYYKKILSIDQSMGMPLHFIPFNDTLFIATGSFKKDRYGVYNKGDLLFTFGNFPVINPQARKMNNSQLSAAYISSVVSNKSNKFVSVTKRSDLIEIFKYENGSFTQINKNYKCQYPNTIRVYDWQGNYIADIKTDLPIWDFTVERNGNKHIFYAIAQNDSETSPYILVKYEVEI